jgi:hypothetical protein
MASTYAICPQHFQTTAKWLLWPNSPGARLNRNFSLEPSDPSLMEQLAIPLSQQAGKWLVIPRRRESSTTNIPRSGQSHIVVPLRGDYSIIWIPAYAGMTAFLSIGKSGLNPALLFSLSFCLQLLIRRESVRG